MIYFLCVIYVKDVYFPDCENTTYTVNYIESATDIYGSNVLTELLNQETKINSVEEIVSFEKSEDADFLIVNQNTTINVDGYINYGTIATFTPCVYLDEYSYTSLSQDPWTNYFKEYQLDLNVLLNMMLLGEGHKMTYIKNTNKPDNKEATFNNKTVKPFFIVSPTEYSVDSIMFEETIYMGLNNNFKCTNQLIEMYNEDYLDLYTWFEFYDTAEQRTEGLILFDVFVEGMGTDNYYYDESYLSGARYIQNGEAVRMSLGDLRRVGLCNSGSVAEKYDLYYKEGISVEMIQGLLKNY